MDDDVVRGVLGRPLGRVAAAGCRFFRRKLPDREARRSPPVEGGDDEDELFLRNTRFVNGTLVDDDELLDKRETETSRDEVMIAAVFTNYSEHHGFGLYNL